MDSRYRALLKEALERGHYRVFYAALCRWLVHGKCPANFDWDRYASLRWARSNLSERGLRTLVKLACTKCDKRTSLDSKIGWDTFPFPVGGNLRTREVYDWLIANKVHYQGSCELLLPNDALSESHDVLIEYYAARRTKINQKNKL